MIFYFFLSYIFSVNCAGPAEEQKLFESGNEYRQKKNLPPFKKNSKLEMAAKNQAQYCAKNNILGHNQDNPENAQLNLRIDKTGYQWTTMAENAAQNKGPGAEGILDQWINSPGHNVNLLSDNKDAAYASASSSDGTMYWIGVYASTSDDKNNDEEESKKQKDVEDSQNKDTQNKQEEEKKVNDVQNENKQNKQEEEKDIQNKDTQNKQEEEKDIQNKDAENKQEEIKDSLNKDTQNKQEEEKKVNDVQNENKKNKTASEKNVNNFQNKDQQSKQEIEEENPQLEKNKNKQIYTRNQRIFSRYKMKNMAQNRQEYARQEFKFRNLHGYSRNSEYSNTFKRQRHFDSYVSRNYTSHNCYHHNEGYRRRRIANYRFYRNNFWQQ